MSGACQGSFGSERRSAEHESQGEDFDGAAVTPQVVKEKSLSERRCSPRLRKIPQDKRPFYGNNPRKLSHSTKEGVSGEINWIASSKRLMDVREEGVNGVDAGGSGCDMALPAMCDSAEIFDIEDGPYLKWTNYEQFLADTIGEKASAKVKEMERAFNKHYLHFVQDEEEGYQKMEIGRSRDDAKWPSKRPDLKAISEMLNKKEILCPERRFGHIPGIPVGHKFDSRAEMVAVGFHGHWLNGIDYVGKFCRSLRKYKGLVAPMAVAIVLSCQYKDDVDDLNEVVYTGSGGNDLLGHKCQVKDQVRFQGNLALKYNLEKCIPVRVVRGHKCAESHSGRVYTYCGLYKVVNHRAEKGVSTVFKYRLKRLQGQPKVDLDQVCFQRGRGTKDSSHLIGLVCEDISFGAEVFPIPATNVVDCAPIALAGFRYMNTVQVASTVPIPLTAPGCKCKGRCSNPRACACARLNGSNFPYVQKDGGRLIEPKDVVYECGPNCGCGSDCINRISQRPLKYRLEVYRTENKGWAVRSWDFIPSGAPVCEYTGVIRRNDDLDNVSGNEYIFEMDCWHTMHGIGGRERRQGDPPSSKLKKLHDKIVESETEFCLDGGSCGNVSRFINHSCDPNLFVQCVLSSHHDIRLARIVLFAADNIPPMQELTYDYGYELDSVVGPDGKLKHMNCYCGTSECRGRLY